MWPFKKKEIPFCINCEYIKPNDSKPYECLYQKKNIPIMIDITDGSPTQRQYNLSDRTFCRDFRMWGFCPWMCGKKGRFFKDKRRFS